MVINACLHLPTEGRQDKLSLSLSVLVTEIVTIKTSR